MGVRPPDKPLKKEKGEGGKGSKNTARAQGAGNKKQVCNLQSRRLKYGLGKSQKRRCGHRKMSRQG